MDARYTLPLFSEGWQSMAEALGWGAPDRPSWVVSGGGTESGGGVEVFGATARTAIRRWTREGPAPTLVTSRRTRNGIVTGRQLAPGEERDPAHGGWTLRNAPMGRSAAMRDPAPWTHARLATTLTGQWSPQIVTPSGHRDWSNGEHRQDAKHGVEITLEEACVLQTFPPDFPFAGPRSRKFLQLGNAIPALLAAHVLQSVAL